MQVVEKDSVREEEDKKEVVINKLEEVDCQGLA
jgi:hypothetical protein